MTDGIIDSSSGGRDTPNTYRGKSSGFCTDQMRSCSFGGRTSAGLPTAIQPIGTVVFGGSTVRRWTTPLILTSDLLPIIAPLKTVAPVARKTLSSTSQPLRYALGPTRTRSPIFNGLPCTARNTAVSITTQSSPMVIGPLSAVKTAPKPIEQFAPIVTSPQMIAFGAILALS